MTRDRGARLADQIDGIGKKTASVLLLFCFGQPLLPIDRHVERVMRRVGLLPPKATLDEAHDLVLGLFEPDQMYEAHVNLIQHGRKVCHAQRPEHDACPLRDALPLRRPEGALARDELRGRPRFGGTGLFARARVGRALVLDARDYFVMNVAVRVDRSWAVMTDAVADARLPWWVCQFWMNWSPVAVVPQAGAASRMT